MIGKEREREREREKYKDIRNYQKGYAEGHGIIYYGLSTNLIVPLESPHRGITSPTSKHHIQGDQNLFLAAR